MGWQKDRIIEELRAQLNKEPASLDIVDVVTDELKVAGRVD